MLGTFNEQFGSQLLLFQDKVGRIVGTNILLTLLTNEKKLRFLLVQVILFYQSVDITFPKL